MFRIISESAPLRARRSLLASSGFNQTSITLEFGNLPTPNITSPGPPTVAEEIAKAGETNDSVDLEVMTNSYNTQVSECKVTCMHIYAVHT